MDRQSVEKSVSVSMLRQAATHRQYVEITNEPVCLSVINCTPHRRIHNRPLNDTPIHVGSTIFGGWSFRTTSAISASEKVLSSQHLTNIILLNNFLA